MRNTLLFLQLPQLDNDVSGAHENLRLAAAYLAWSARRAGMAGQFIFRIAGPDIEMLDDHHCARAIIALQPAVIAATLYLWNIERTLRILKLVKTAKPSIKLAVGGPEAAHPHPFLFRAHWLDAIAIGEGEPVFPAILKAFQTGKPPALATVFWNGRYGFRAGHRHSPPVDLNNDLPPPAAAGLAPDSNGMAYLETTRGCPTACAYCRYAHLRSSMSHLASDRVERRVRTLMRQGAREIRLIAPTFNAHPAFDEMLERLCAVNCKKRVKFFAELRADTITPRQAALLARANVAEIEVGMQSREPAVLRQIRRPTRLSAFDRGVALLSRRKIRVTLDVMYGLPSQRKKDVIRSLRWAERIPRVNPQCMQTLLLPGTDLYDERRRLGLTAGKLPPYGVTATPTMPFSDIAAIESFLDSRKSLRSDCRTSRFVGPRLPDLFPERLKVAIAGPLASDGVLEQWIDGVMKSNQYSNTPSFHYSASLRDADFADRHRLPAMPGKSARRALMIGANGSLFEQRTAIGRLVRNAIRCEPYILWQFVLLPNQEEPLDLLDQLAAIIRAEPPHLLDRYAGVRSKNMLAARRLFVMPGRSSTISNKWIRAADELLTTAFQ